MGNSSTKNVFLSVNGSRTCVVAGSTITGEIRCPDHSLSNDLFSGVTLWFIGKEDVEVRYTEAGHGTKGGPKYKTAKRDIVRTIIPLDTSQNSARCPFEFRVPDQLPSSFYYQDDNGGFCAIRYKIKLHLSRFRGKDQEIPVDIIAKPPTTPVPSVADPMTYRMSFMHCLPQGSITWAVGAEDTRVGVGEELTINLGLKNESLARLERVSAKLKQTVEFRTSGVSPHHSTNKTIIRSSSFERVASMKPKSKRELQYYNLRRKAQLKRSHFEDAQPLTVYEEVLGSVKEGENQLKFPIPDYIVQTYTGKLIKIRHYVSIEAKTPSFFTSPKIHIPIEIVSPRHTPVVTATIEAIPAPSAPSRSDDGYSSSFSFSPCASDASAVPVPYLDSTFVVGTPAPVLAGGEEEIAVDSVEQQKPSTTGSEEEGAVCETSEERDPPQQPEFNPLLEPLISRDALFDSGRM